MKSLGFTRVARALVVLLLVATASACASKPKMHSDYDTTVDFSQYKTYNFYADAGPDETRYQSLFTQYMIAAIDREMQDRGYEKSGVPDLLVNFNGNLEDRTKIMSAPASGTYYGYRGYGAWNGYSLGSSNYVVQYTEGTFNIDLVDRVQQQLVWEAVSVGTIRDKDLDDLQQTIDQGVPEFFKSFPFVAGQGTPVGEQ